MAAPSTQFQQVLDWIGFTVLAQRNSVEQELGDFASVEDSTHKDTRDLHDSHAKRTVVEGRTHFGMNRTKRLKALIEWLKDLDCINEDPDVADFNRDEFLEAVNESADRAVI